MTLLPSPDMTQFKFRPLEEADAIRLLVLYPSHETTAPLSGSLINTTLSACDSDFANGYLALSYVWGKPASTSSIQIDGIDVRITDNLAEALTQVRNAYLGAPQRIWADALCINQSDTAEKNRQVPLMGNIYSLAKTTVIYLGPLSPGIETIFKAVHDSKPGFVTVDAAGDSRIALAKDLRQPKKFDVKAGSEPPAAAIDELLQRPWFTRVWVMQELFLSSDAWVQCGALRVRWRELGALLVPILDQTKGKGSTALQQMYSLRLNDANLMGYCNFRKAQEENLPLSHILRMRQDCRASNPRDMIFGYMGMHTDRSEVAKYFTVDYEMPLRQLLILTARYMYSRDGLEVVLRCIKRPPTNNWLNLPSWVPDWGIHEWSQATSNTGDTIPVDEMLLGVVERPQSHWPHRDPKFIRYISPVLPRPQDVPQSVVGFVEKAAHIMRTFGDYEYYEQKALLEVENVSFWRNLDIGSPETQNSNPVRLFPDSFWDSAVEDEGKYPRKNINSGMRKTPCKEIFATRAYQTLSFFKEYVGSRISSASGFEDAFKWHCYEGQRIRLALSTAGFVLAVPSYVEVGDVFMRLERSSAMNRISHYDDDVFGGLLRLLEKDTGDSRVKAFKWLCFDGVPLCREHWYKNSDFGRFAINSMRRLLPTEVDNDGLKWYDACSGFTSGDLKHIELY